MTRAALLGALALAPCAALLAGMVTLLAPALTHDATRAAALAAPLGAVLAVTPGAMLLGAWTGRSATPTRAALTLRLALDALGGVPAGILGGALGALGAKADDAGGVVTATCALVALPPLARGASRAAESVSRDLLDAALALGASRVRALVTVALASAWRPAVAGILRASARAIAETAALVVALLAARGPSAALALARDRAAPATAAILAAAAVLATLLAGHLERRE